MTDRLRAEYAPLIPAAVILALLVIWIPASGAYYPDAWYPSALGSVLVVAATMIVRRQVLPQSRVARVALLAFLALVAFNYLSITWAVSKGSALQASNQLVLYAAIAWTFSLLPWTPRSLAALLGAWSLGIAVFCATGLLQATSSASLEAFFVQLRYAVPLHYPNATGAIAVMGMWPALILAARREVPMWLRPVLLAIAVFLAEFALLPQSRAALLGMIVTAPIALIVVSDRVALLLRMAVIGGGLAISVPRTVAVDDAINAGRHVGPVLERAANAMLITTLIALAVGVVLGLAEARWAKARAGREADQSRDPEPATPRPRRPPLSRRAKIAIAAIVVVAVSGAVVAVAPAAVHAVRSVWKAGNKDASTGSTRLLSATPEERFDYVRVALKLFAGSPVGGIGAANFGRRYDALRRFQKHSQYTHNLPLRVLSETGIIGFGLFLAVIGALAVGMIGVLRRSGGLARACCAAALLVAIYFMVHASLDWVDEFPALAVPAFAFPMAVLAMRSERATPRVEAPDPEPAAAAPPPATRRRAPRPLRVAAAALAVVLGIGVYGALTTSYLASRYVERAFATYKTQPSAAFNDLRRAEDLNPLSADPITSEGTISLYLAQPTRARSAFARAIRLESNWYPWLEMALLDAETGDFASASKEVNAAAALDVNDPLVAEARTMISNHQRIDPVAFNQQFVQGPQAALFQSQNIK